MIKQSFTYWSFAHHQLSPQALFDGAKRIGYDAIELVDEELFSLVKDSGLAIATHRAFTSLEEGLNHQENHQAIFKEFESNLKLAEQWHIPNLIGFSGNRKGLSDTKAIDTMVKALQHMATMAEDAGVTVLLEPLNSKVDHPDYHCDNTPLALKVIDQVASKHVKILYDVYHMQVMEGDIIRTIKQHHSHFGHYHTAGNPGRHELNSTQELNYAAIFKAISETNYSGYIGHEFIPTQDVLASLKEAFELVQTN